MENGLHIGFCGVDSFVGSDGLLFGVGTLWQMSIVGAFSSFLVPSVGFLGFLSGDDDDDRFGGSTLNRSGTNALRPSSTIGSLPDSLRLVGVLEGLPDAITGAVNVVPITGLLVVVVSAMYSGLCSKYEESRIRGNVGLSRSPVGEIVIAPAEQREIG